MDKNAIKKYAVWARNELIARIAQKANQYGITEAEIISASADSIHGKLLTPTEKKQRTALIERIKTKGKNGFQLVMEEVAYTWFNRFTAIRFMEVNRYLPTHIRVFTDEENRFAPQILAEAIHLDMPGLNMDKVFELKQANKTEELYKYLLITQCNALNEILPRMFQKIEDYSELLLPDNLLREGSVIEQMITLIPEEDWKDQVQIIGWLYQYYNTEPKDLVFSNLKNNIKISKENIPAATQIFTPDWIVRYMVENSLGRMWLEGHPNDELKANWEYYIEEANQEESVKTQLEKFRSEYANIKPEEIKVIDPCMGSGHILCYMFDVLIQIYEAYGYTARDAASLIIENNIYGLDIDDRAAQLSYFAIMMKARQHDRRFLARHLSPNVYSITESNIISKDAVEYFINQKDTIKENLEQLIKIFKNAKEYGSIINVSGIDLRVLFDRLREIEDDVNLYRSVVEDDVAPIIACAALLQQHYHVVVTNPPYMSSSGMSTQLSDYVKQYYPLTKSDMSTVFMEKTLDMCLPNGYTAMINIPVWMFLSSYEELRKKLLLNSQFTNLLHLGRGVFGADFGTTSFVIRKGNIRNYISTFRKLYERQGSVDDNEKKIRLFLNGYGNYLNKQDSFMSIPNYCIAYSASPQLLSAFKEGIRVDSFTEPKQGLATADNNRFLRFWHEVAFTNIKFSCGSHEESAQSKEMWYPYNKGGGFQKWYGNNEYVINWANDGLELNAFSKSVIRSPQFYFRECLSWCKVTISGFSMRYIPQGFLFDVAGCSLFVPKDKMRYVLGFANSAVNAHILSIISPTVNYEVGHVASLPILESPNAQEVDMLVSRNIQISKDNWDAYETSWDFTKHPFIPCRLNDETFLSDMYLDWESSSNNRFEELQNNEVRLNQIFIETYRLKNELTPTVSDSAITIERANIDADIRSFISYAVGCMFGRYSLDVDGIVYAGGEWNDEKYISFKADRDNVLPICDDEYFEDDIVGKFVKFVGVVFGKDSLEENLKFIADALGGSGSPRDVIRSYFLNDFYADHLKVYQKRPIYWQFDSGKKNGFKCLIYMHRYQPDTIARIRTDYVHEQQARYRTAIADLEQRIQVASTSERVKLTKQLQKLKDQETEIRIFEEKVHHLADQMIRIDLDDGVKHNYEIFKDVLTKIK